MRRQYHVLVQPILFGEAESVRVDDDNTANSLLSQVSTNVQAVATGTLGSIR